MTTIQQTLSATPAAEPPEIRRIDASDLEWALR